MQHQPCMLCLCGSRTAIRLHADLTLVLLLVLVCCRARCVRRLTGGSCTHRIKSTCLWRAYCRCVMTSPQHCCTCTVKVCPAECHVMFVRRCEVDGILTYVSPQRSRQLCYHTCWRPGFSDIIDRARVALKWKGFVALIFVPVLCQQV